MGLEMFQWEEFREIANELLNNSQEAYLRCATSRNYYAVFGSTREYLIDIMHKYELEDGNNIHKRVYDELIKSHDMNEVHLAKCLNFLRIARNHADYDKFDECPKYFEEKLDKIIKKTNDAFESLEALKNNPPFKF